MGDYRKLKPSPISGLDAQIVVEETCTGTRYFENEVSNVTNFTMNDKCAAGTRRFLELMSNTLGEDIDFGVVESITSKVKSLCQKHSDSFNYFLTRGLSSNRYIVKKLEEKLGSKVSTNEFGRYAGAIGAAISANKIK